MGECLLVKKKDDGNLRIKIEVLVSEYFFLLLLYGLGPHPDALCEIRYCAAMPGLLHLLAVGEGKPSVTMSVHSLVSW